MLNEPYFAVTSTFASEEKQWGFHQLHFVRILAYYDPKGKPFDLE